MYNFLCQNVLISSIYIIHKDNSNILGQMSQNQKRKSFELFTNMFKLHQVTGHPPKISSVKMS